MVCQDVSPSSPPVEPKKAENEESVNPSGETEKQANPVWVKGPACETEKPVTFRNSWEVENPSHLGVFSDPMSPIIKRKSKE